MGFQGGRSIFAVPIARRIPPVRAKAGEPPACACQLRGGAYDNGIGGNRHPRPDSRPRAEAGARRGGFINHREKISAQTTQRTCGPCARTLRLERKGWSPSRSTTPVRRRHFKAVRLRAAVSAQSFSPRMQTGRRRERRKQLARSGVWCPYIGCRKPCDQNWGLHSCRS
jgi:hypothetical protein